MSTIIRRSAWALPIVAVLWVGLMAMVMRISDAAPAAVVPFPSAALLRDLPGDAALLGLSSVAVTLPNRPGLTAELYAAGAWLVLPAGLTGCLPLPKAARAALRAG